MGHLSRTPPQWRGEHVRHSGRVQAQVVVAVIAAVAAVLSAVFAGVVQARLRRSERSHDERARQQVVVDRYREPLVQAAHELQSRLWNIARGGFLERYHLGARPEDGPEQYATDSTVWLVAQYFCWAEIVRREVQFIPLTEPDDTARLRRVVTDISHRFGTDSLVGPLRVFRSHQHAIGELMITTGRDAHGQERSDCLGYAAFTVRLTDEDFAQWLQHLRSDVHRLATGAPLDRVREVQHLLVDLVDLVDTPPLRFPNPDRSKLP